MWRSERSVNSREEKHKHDHQHHKLLADGFIRTFNANEKQGEAIVSMFQFNFETIISMAHISPVIQMPKLMLIMELERIKTAKKRIVFDEYVV